jgi:hypothetical protein
LGLDPIKKLLPLITGHKAKAHSKRKQKKTWLTNPIYNFRVVSLYLSPLLLSLDDDKEFVAHLFYIRKTKEFGNSIQIPLEMAQGSLPFYNSQFHGKHFPNYLQ